MDFSLFISQLGEKLKAEGLPMLEDDLIKLNAVLFGHMREFQYDNDLVKAIVPVLATVLEPLAVEALEQIDKSDNPVEEPQA